MSGLNTPTLPTNRVARTLCEIVKDKPGIHFRALEREAELSSLGQLRHHLDRLQRQGLVVELEDGGYKRFFLAGEHDRHVRPCLARFSRPVPRRIGRLLLVRPMNRTELRRTLGCADSTLGYHLARMVQAGDLVKQRGANCCRYALADPLLVRQVLELQDQRHDHPERPVAPAFDSRAGDHEEDRKVRVATP